MKIRLKTLGATLMISGTTVGAGMLALPLISAAMGFEYTLLTLVIVWGIMAYTGLMLLELCLALPKTNSFYDIAKTLFGSRGVYIINGCFLLLLYAICAAYISGGASTYRANLGLFLGFTPSNLTIALGFTLIIAAIVIAGTLWVDRINRILFGSNIAIFLVMTSTMQPYVHPSYFHSTLPYFKYSLAALPVFVTAFGFHTSIPSVVKYVGREEPKTLQRIILWGSFLPLVIYTIWEFSTMGLLPRTGAISFTTIAQHNGSIGLFLEQIHHFITEPIVPILLSLFSSIALFTSYLCVSLGLFDTLNHTLKLPETQFGRFKTAAVTFVPPLLIELCYPQGFVTALGASAIFLTLLAILFPAFGLQQLKLKNWQILTIRGSNHRYMMKLMFLIGLMIIGLQLLQMQGMLPVL